MTKEKLDHPIADLFPLATEAELAGLAADIREHGQIEAIDLFEGKILDGRNRYRACVLVGVTPRCEEWETNGVAPQDYVVAKNLHRRHLTIAQRATLGQKLLDYEREEAKKRVGGRPRGEEAKPTPNAEQVSLRNKNTAAQRAADKVGVGRTSVLAADLIAKKGTKEAKRAYEKMEKGEISVTAAATEAGVATGTWTKRKPRLRLTSEQVQASATAADNIDAAHFYTGLASNVLLAFDQIPRDRLEELLAKAVVAVEWWQEIVAELKKEVGK